MATNSSANSQQQRGYISTALITLPALLGLSAIPPPPSTKISRAAIHTMLPKTEPAVTQTFGLGFDKTFSFEPMLRLKRPLAAMGEVLNSTAGRAAPHYAEEERAEVRM